MSLQPVRIVLFLPFLSIVSAGTHPSTSSPSFSVIQTPLFLNVSEGSDVTLNCNMEGNVSSKWFVTWKKMGEKDNIKNSKWIFVTTHKINKSSILTLKSTVIDDSGIYHCEFGDSGHSQSGNTSVTIWGRQKNINVNGDDSQAGSPQENTGGGIVIPVVVGVAMGKLVFLLLLGAVVWRLKRKNKGSVLFVRGAGCQRC
ncbi:uncharacterized protein M6D78_013858 isoform 1-T1 [Vipera latastei]